jgi:hypothetical protein
MERRQTFISVVVIAIIAVILQVVIEPEGPWIFIICGILIALEVCCTIDDIDNNTLVLADFIDEECRLSKESMEDLVSKMVDLQLTINKLEEKINKINKRDTTYDPPIST